MGPFSYPAEYLCEGDVYALDITELPPPEDRSPALLSMFQIFAFVLAYTATSLASFKQAQHKLEKL